MYHAYNPNDYALLRTVLQHIVKNTDEDPHIKATADSAYDATYLVGEYGQYKIPNLLESRSISTDALMSVTNDNVIDAEFAATADSATDPTDLFGEYGHYKISNLLESRSISTDALMSVTNDNVIYADFAATIRAWKIPNNRVVSTFIDEFNVVSDHIQAFTQA